MTSLNNQKQTAAVLALSLALLNTAGAIAQGLVAGPMGTLSQSSALGSDQESMLPPEVVPLDASVAQKLSQSQADARALQASTPAPGMAPGLVGELPSGYQSAQDARKNMFQGLLNQGQGQISPINQYLNPAQTQAAMMNPMAPGQPGWSANNSSANPNVSTLVAHQTQTLTGGSKNVPTIQDTKQGGASTAASSSMALGSGLLLGRGIGGAGGIGSLGSLGFFGLGATGFGTRNGFRL